MKVLIQIYLFLKTIIRTTNNENEVMFKSITDKKIHTLKYYDHNGKKINSLLNSKDTCEKNALVSDKILWNINLPKPFYLNIYYPTNKDSNFKIEFNDLKNDVLHHVYIQNTTINNIKFIKGSISSKEKAIMKSSFDPLNQNNNNFTVSDTDGNLDLLNTSVKYCYLVEQIVNLSKIIKENLEGILFEVKDFEKVYNNLSITYAVEEVGNVYSRTMYKLINHIFYNLSRLYFIESIKDDLLKFEELEKLLEKIYCEISTKITHLKEKISNNKDIVVIEDLEQKYITGFENRIRNFTKFKSLYSAIQSVENIITSSKKVISSIQSTKIIKSIELNNMENFHKFYSPLIKNSFELIYKKHMEFKILKAFEDEYYDLIYNNFDQLESDSYDFVLFKYMVSALKRYENNPRPLKFIFFFEYFLSMKVSTIIANLEKEKIFYEKILVKLDINTDQKFIVYIKSILDNIKTCSKAWKDIYKVGRASKAIKEKTMLDLIKESKDNSKLPYDTKLNYQTPDFPNINEYIKEIDEDTFYRPTKDEILEFLQHENTVNSSNITIVQNLESDRANELVLSYAKELVLPSDEIQVGLPNNSCEEINELNGENERIATVITNYDPLKNVDKQQEQIIEQNSAMDQSPSNPSSNEESQFKKLIENYYKFMFPDKDLCDYQEEFSLNSLPVTNSLENLAHPKSTNELYKISASTTSKDEQNSLYKNPLPCTSNYEQKLSYSNSPPSTNKDQSYFWPTSPSTNSTNSRSYRPINIPTYNREDLYYSSDSLSSNESSLSKEHSDVDLDKFLLTNLTNVYSEQIPSNKSRQNNIVCRRSNSGPINSIRNRNANRVNSKNNSVRKRSNSLPCLSCKDKFLKYYNLPHENNDFYDSALGISLDTSYDSTPEDCLFDLYVDSDHTERYNAVSLLNTWIDIKNLDPDCYINVEDDNQTINNDSNDSEIWSETIDKEDDMDDLETQVNISLEETKDIQAKQGGENVPYKQSEINESHNTETNDQNLKVLKPEYDKDLKIKNTQNESYGSEVTAIDESIIQNNFCNLVKTNCNILTTTDAKKINNTKVLELNSVTDPSVTSAGCDVPSESSAAKVDDKILKSVEVLAQVDISDLQFSGTMINSNLKKPVSVNERSLETLPEDQHDLDDSKEKQVSKLNPESVNSTNDIISEVTGDVLNQLDMSILKNSQQAEISLEKSTDQVINSPPNVSKDANSPSNVSRDDNALSKILNDANLPYKVSNDVNLPSNVSKDNNLPSKSSDGTKNLNSNIAKQIYKKASTENKNQANSSITVDKQNSGLSNQKAKNLQPNNQNATKPDEKLKNKPPGIKISFGFSRSDNILQRSRRT